MGVTYGGLDSKVVGIGAARNENTGHLSHQALDTVLGDWECNRVRSIGWSGDGSVERILVAIEWSHDACRRWLY